MEINNLLHLLIWFFIADVILLFLFEKDGYRIKWRIKSLIKKLNPYIKVQTYMLVYIIIIGLIYFTDTKLKLIDKYLIGFIGSIPLLWVIVVSFDIFYAFKYLGNVSIKHKWCKGSLIVFLCSLGIFILTKVV